MVEMQGKGLMAAGMTLRFSSAPKGCTAVIFVARRNSQDESGYAAAAQQMELLAREQDGYLGHESARSADGLGITVSYWRAEADAKAWRDHPDHAAVREQGRGLWYDFYSLQVCTVERSYTWEAPQ